MGYYSEVAAMMLKKDYEDLISKIKAHEFPEDVDYTVDEIEKYALGLLNDGRTCTETYDYNSTSDVFVRLYWESIKWYTSIPYIALIEQYFYDHKVDFIRIGEEASDIEEHYGLQRYEVEVIRTLSFC